MAIMDPSEQRNQRCQSAPPTFGAAIEATSPPERYGSAPPMLEHEKITAVRAPGVSLSELPVELRIMIFEHVLIAPQEIKIRPSEYDGKKIETPADHKSEQANIAALLQVNKQTHSETKKLLYGMNTFSFSAGIVEGLNASALRAFLDSVAKENLACIQRIAISPYLPRRAWAGVGRRGEEADELECMARSVVKHLAGVQNVELNLDGPYGPPVRRCPAVRIEKRSGNVRKVKKALRALRERDGLKVLLRAGAWLNKGKLMEVLGEENFSWVVEN